MAIEPIKGFYVHDEATNTDGVAKVDATAVEGVGVPILNENGGVEGLSINGVAHKYVYDALENEPELNERRTAQLFNKDEAVIFNGYCGANGVIANNNYRSVVLPVSILSETTFTIHRRVITSRFDVCAIEETTVTGGETILATGLVGADNYTYNITAPANTNSLLIYFYNGYAGDTQDVIQPFLNSLMIEYGTEYTGYKPYYEYPNAFIDDITVRYKETVSVHLGTELVVNSGYHDGDEWSGSLENGYTHQSATSINSLSFYVPDVEENAIYLLEFDTSYTDDEFVKVGIGSAYRVLVYSGGSHIVVPLRAIGTLKNLFFTPTEANLTFTISNISLKKIQDTGTEKELAVYDVETINHLDNYGFWNVSIGKNSMEQAVGSTRTIALGYASMNALQGGHRNVGVGTFTMSQMTGGENNIAVGADAMLAVKSSNDSIAIGKGTMYSGQLVEDNVAIGHYALNGSASSSNSKRNVAIGKNSGWYSYGQDNTFVGYQAGYRCENTNGNTCIGKNSLGESTGNHNTSIGEETGFTAGCNNTIALGYGAKATKSYQMMLGNSSITEVVMCGNKKIVFNSDGTVTWETVS